MKKIYSIFLSVTALIMLLTGCGNSVANEKRIQEDLISYTGFLDDGEEIKRVEIEKRQTEKDKKVDTVWGRVTTEDGECSYEKEVVLTYGLYDKGGWILDNVSVNNKKGWSITPLVGIKEDDIPASLKNQSIKVNGEQWSIIPKEISISQHDTDLESRTDTITARITIEDTVQKATGELTLGYYFEDAWKIKTISGEESFAVSTIEGKELNVTEEKLIEAISGQEYKYGIPENATIYYTSELQTVTINKSELSNLVIDDTQITSKGTLQIYTCHCTLSKPHAEFLVDAGLEYYYSDSGGWTLQPTNITLKCTSMALQGEWKGTYSGVGNKQGQAVLSITDIAADGTITGTYSYTPDTISTYSHAGSYYVSGKADLTTMSINLEAGEWINEPSKKHVFEKHDVSAKLYVDNSLLWGKGQEGNIFKLTQ